MTDQQQCDCRPRLRRIAGAALRLLEARGLMLRPFGDYVFIGSRIADPEEARLIDVLRPELHELLDG